MAWFKTGGLLGYTVPTSGSERRISASHGLFSSAAPPWLSPAQSSSSLHSAWRNSALATRSRTTRERRCKTAASVTPAATIIAGLRRRSTALAASSRRMRCCRSRLLRYAGSSAALRLASISERQNFGAKFLPHILLRLTRNTVSPLRSRSCLRASGPRASCKSWTPLMVNACG